ncbi:MAG: MFS transporter [Pseudomonadota bacterium]
MTVAASANQNDQAVESAGALLASIGLTVIAVAAFLVLPIYVGAAADSLQISASQIGVLSACVALGSAVSSIAMMVLVRRVPWRLAGFVTLSLMLVSMGLSIVVDNPTMFMLLQAMAALGGGATYSLALTALSDRKNADRGFGLSIAAQVSFQVVGMLLFPRLVASAGIDGMLGVFFLLEAVGLALVLILPRSGKARAASVDDSASLLKPALLLALGGCLFFFLNVGVVWTYVERMAVLAGFTGSQIGNSLAVGVATGIPGALCAAWLGERFGRLGPLAFAAIGTLVALWLLDSRMSLTAYVTAMVLYNFAWNFSLTFQYSAVNAVDGTGRGVAASPAFHGLGAAIGPGIAAMLVTESSLAAVNWLAGLAVVVSLLLFVSAILWAGREGIPGTEDG